MKARTFFFAASLGVVVVSAIALLITLPLFLGGKKDASLVIKGSTTVFPIINKCVEAFKRTYPNALIRVSPCGSGAGIAALIDGTADIAMSSRPLLIGEERVVVNRGLTIERYVIGRDGIAVIVNPQNLLNHISIDQLCDIYSGKTLDWKELDNPPGIIVPISRDLSSGTFGTLSEKVLGAKKLRADAQLIPSNQSMVQSVAANKNAIGYIGLGYVDESIKVLAVEGFHPERRIVKSGKYPLSRDLFLFTRGNDSDVQRRFLHFVFGSEGQRIVQNEGFIPIENSNRK